MSVTQAKFLPSKNKHCQRHKSTSDPFSNPIHSSKPAPRLPPISPSKLSSRNMFTPIKPHRDKMIEAVRDTVQVRNPDHSPRTRLGRSQSTVPPASGAHNRSPPAGRRSQSQDSVLQAANALEKAKTVKTRTKKGSMHADVIDRLDFTSVGPMFHHDGPFDACAPSRNRHRTKAPMLAWSSTPTEEPTEPNRSLHLSPDIYKATISSSYDSSKRRVDAIAEAWGTHEPEPYQEFFAGGGSVRYDGDNPSNSNVLGYEGHGSRSHTTSKRQMENRDIHEVYREYLDDDVKAKTRDPTDREPHYPSRRSPLPPPQPIIVPESGHADKDGISYSPVVAHTSGAPKRNTSLMHRIRKMRDAPNVPIGYEEATGPLSVENSSTVLHGRPTHRTHNSFLGRFTGVGVTGSRTHPQDNSSPTSDSSDVYVYIDGPRKEKQLPETPHIDADSCVRSSENEIDGFFDGVSSSPGSPTGLGRKTSLLKKVKDAVRGNK
ncbi:hypothetical protein SERLA73DRAFT_192246 [Serpula lacrymans var. lacrymans S7.3]|uniref:Pal1-domain-containing protein n=2 Tax=Serpula lacrymans var. lacrymans TaxID=341189 RepID=F8QJE3_SERL3|nr:uncharacterized protein SERLADRAFT_454923 [Serpula lacrymans var. lacrymans S7.9]EGN91576.1 hypothetical protein SERLA73DRAFT_192246 [Serpula lacrymans var. lacrymans S7.3]EGO30632.1 hypothetical protein SERLADRAFT_454923 [Serpula lacrymans var. lacrymans S7.9]